MRSYGREIQLPDGQHGFPAYVDCGWLLDVAGCFGWIVGGSFPLGTLLLQSCGKRGAQKILVEELNSTAALGENELRQDSKQRYKNRMLECRPVRHMPSRS